MIIRERISLECPECKGWGTIKNDEKHEKIFVMCSCGKWCKMVDFRIKEKNE